MKRSKEKLTKMYTRYKKLYKARSAKSQASSTMLSKREFNIIYEDAREAKLGDTVKAIVDDQFYSRKQTEKYRAGFKEIIDEIKGSKTAITPVEEEILDLEEIINSAKDFKMNINDIAAVMFNYKYIIGEDKFGEMISPKEVII